LSLFQRCQVGLLALALLLTTFSFSSFAYADDSLPTVTTITSTSTTPTTINLNWTSTESEYPITQFQIAILPIGGPLFVIYDPAVTAGTIAGLSPDTTYQLQFTTISAAPPPTGAYFDIIDMTLTTQSLGSTPPTTTASTPYIETTSPTFTSLVATTRAVTIVWVPATNPVYPIVRYVADALAKGKIVSTASSGTSSHSLTIRRLKPKSEYKIILTAHLEIGSIQITRDVITK
jgi:hypothetical protein